MHPLTRRRRDRAGLIPHAIIVLACLIGRAAAQPAEQEEDVPTTVIAEVERSGEDPTALFVDFMHYARLGRFERARAFARALLEHPDLDPVQLLEVADKDRKSFDTLIKIVSNSTIGEEAKRVLDVLRQGEAMKARDPQRINQNIEKLGGTPQAEFNAIQLLAVSAEHAVPWMVQAMIDPAREHLRTRVIRALPKLGQPAVTPLAVALEIPNRDAKLNIIRALGELGYPHAVPYLKKLMADSQASEDIRAAASDAIGRIAQQYGRPFPGSPAQDFVELAGRYYNEEGSLRADPRDVSANVWYWRDNFLVAVSVPREIFGPVMAMRCTEEALGLEPDFGSAIALWQAANIRREGRLGLDVESGEPVDEHADRTRPAGFPRALFFTQSGGARYAHDVLARAVADRDAQVALGAIAALRAVAGEAGLIGREGPQPLVSALSFPDSLVRARAALALAEALPRSQFAGSDRVTPVLGESLLLTGRQNYVVIEPREQNLNRVVDILRQGGAQVVGDTDLHRALDRARQELRSVSGVFLSTALVTPSVGRAVEALRGEYMFGITPIVLLETPGDPESVARLMRSDARIARVPADSPDQDLMAVLSELMAKSGQSRMTPDAALALAMESAAALLDVARDGRTVLNVAPAEPSLISVLETAEDEPLRIRAAAVLGYSQSQSAQRALAAVGLDDKGSQELRIAVLGALAESAKVHGNLLTDAQVMQLVALTADGPSLTLRTAASQALGALNLADNKASELIRKYRQK